MRGLSGRVSQRWVYQARRIRLRTVMMAVARARKNSVQARRRSVLRRSLPKLFIHEFVRSTTQRPSVWIGVFVPRLLMRGLISRSASQ
jgi:hypothetical protein